MAKRIDDAANEQKCAINEIMNAIVAINDITQNNANGSIDLATDSGKLASMADGFYSLVADKRLGQNR